MKIVALLLFTLGLLVGQEREGNFNIRFQPTADLQTGVEVPFEVHVVDALKKPLQDAKLVFRIETVDGHHAQVFKAPAVGPGVYVAKPIFTDAGQWNIHVEVRRADQKSERDIVFNVPR